MSLIEEALRQVQETAPTTTPAHRSPVPAPRVATPIAHTPLRPVSSRADSSMPAAAMASLALVGLVSVVWLASGWWQARVLPAGTLPRPALASRHASSASSQLPAQPSATPAVSFVLSGIMDQCGEKMAVVNNTIVQDGDLVDGARVLEVRSDSVWLRTKNQDVILKTGR